MARGQADDFLLGAAERLRGAERGASVLVIDCLDGLGEPAICLLRAEEGTGLGTWRAPWTLLGGESGRGPRIDEGRVAVYGEGALVETLRDSVREGFERERTARSSARWSRERDVDMGAIAASGARRRLRSFDSSRHVPPLAGTSRPGV